MSALLVCRDLVLEDQEIPEPLLGEAVQDLARMSLRETPSETPGLASTDRFVAIVRGTLSSHQGPMVRVSVSPWTPDVPWEILIRSVCVSENGEELIAAALAYPAAFARRTALEKEFRAAPQAFNSEVIRRALDELTPLPFVEHAWFRMPLAIRVGRQLAAGVTTFPRAVLWLDPDEDLPETGSLPVHVLWHRYVSENGQQGFLPREEWVSPIAQRVFQDALIAVRRHRGQRDYEIELERRYALERAARTVQETQLAVTLGRHILERLNSRKTP